VHRIANVFQLTALWCLLGGWIGALLLFSVVVAPTAFQVLSGPETAGKLVGPVLRSLNLYGAAAGVALAVLAARLGRGRLLMVLPLVMGLLCLVSQFGVTAEIERIRPLAFGPAPDGAALARFGRLHGLSVTLFGITGVSALVLAWLHAGAEFDARRTP
jgi:hypothetical protein